MKALVSVIAALLMTSAACTRTIYTPVTSASTDSVYTATARHDTLYMLDSVRVEVRGDSVKEQRCRTIYRTVTLTDTVVTSRTDTVRITMPPEKTKGDAPSWRLPAIIAGTLLCLLVVRNIIKA